MLAATVLTNTHTFGPSYFGFPSLYLMNNDDRSDTMAAPPPSQDDIETRPRASEAPLADTQPPDADEAEAEAEMRTLLPPGLPTSALVDASDSLIGQLIAKISETALEMRTERKERKQFADASAANQATLISQQNQILAELQRAHHAAEANQKLLLDAYHRLDAGQRSHAEQIEFLRGEVETLKAESNKRLSDLEQQLQALSDPAPRTTAT